MGREAQIKRQTKETDIQLGLKLEGTGKLKADCPLPFFTHMLDHLVRYSMFDLEIKIKGDIEIDGHHTVEDTGIVLGEALRQALGNKAGIWRYGQQTLPMDDVLVSVAVDFSGRPYFKYSGPAFAAMGSFSNYDAELTQEFFHKLAIHAAMNLHILVHYGENRHHIHEAIFKAAGFALRQAAALDPQRQGEIPSTKGSL